MTGMNPGKHGVFDFFKYDDEGKRRIITAMDIFTITLWEILSDSGKHSIIMKVPGTYPPFEINGIIVSGMLTPEEANFVYPPKIKSLLDKISDGYRINENSNYQSNKELIDDVYLVTEKQKKSFLYLLKKEEWDFSMVMFRGTDIIQHHFWEEKEIINKFYQYMDLAIGEIKESFPKAQILIISDHGFQSQRKNFYPNKWLIDKGFMEIKTMDSVDKRLEEIGKLNGRGELSKRKKKLQSRSLLKIMFEKIGFTKTNIKKYLPKFF